jgi:RNA recognition motif-containing protein
MSKKLYVGNLSFDTTENDLDALFAQSGEVESVRIITDRDSGRSRGFGFVEMSDESGEKAISQFNGAELAGRQLTVNEARPQADRDGGGGGRGRREYGRY